MWAEIREQGMRLFQGADRVNRLVAFETGRHSFETALKKGNVDELLASIDLPEEASRIQVAMNAGRLQGSAVVPTAYVCQLV